MHCLHVETLLSLGNVFSLKLIGNQHFLLGLHSPVTVDWPRVDACPDFACSSLAHGGQLTQEPFCGSRRVCFSTGWDVWWWKWRYESVLMTCESQVSATLRYLSISSFRLHYSFGCNPVSFYHIPLLVNAVAQLIWLWHLQAAVLTNSKASPPQIGKWILESESSISFVPWLAILENLNISHLYVLWPDIQLHSVNPSYWRKPFWCCGQGSRGGKNFSLCCFGF